MAFEVMASDKFKLIYLFSQYIMQEASFLWYITGKVSDSFCRVRRQMNIIHNKTIEKGTNEYYTQQNDWKGYFGDWKGYFERDSFQINFREWKWVWIKYTKKNNLTLIHFKLKEKRHK